MLAAVLYAIPMIGVVIDDTMEVEFDRPDSSIVADYGNGGRTRLAMHASGLAELVAREEELQPVLRRWWKAKSGEGQVALLSGEPGIDKSRLAAALLERCATEPHTRLRYFCLPQHTDRAVRTSVVLAYAAVVMLDLHLMNVEHVDKQFQLANKTIELFTKMGVHDCPPPEAPAEKKQETRSGLRAPECSPTESCCRLLC